jgi:hypothetical protein
MLLDFDPTVIAIGSQPFWLRWSEGSGRPVARRHRDRAPCDADVVQPVGVAVIDSPRTPGDYRRHRVSGWLHRWAAAPLNPVGGRIHACPVSTDSAGVLAAVLMTLTEVFVSSRCVVRGITA